MADAKTGEAPAPAMSDLSISDPPADPPAAAGEAPEGGLTKAQLKKLEKEKAKAEKEAKKAEAERKQAEERAAKERLEDENDPLKENYGDAPMIQSAERTGKKWTVVDQLDENMVDKEVLIRGRVHNVRGKGKSAFLVVRQQTATVQVVFFVDDKTVSKPMVKYVSKLTSEAIIDVQGVVTKPDTEIAGCTQKVEIKPTKVYTVSKSAPVLPFQLDDAARSETALKENPEYVRVGQDTRLDNRTIDLRTPANLAIFRLQSAIGTLFRQTLLEEDFIEIHSPKTLAGSSEGGASVFNVQYMGQPGCLAQSPQLYKQMAICSDFGRVFEVGPVFRAENSFTHRHLCEFTGLDMEMEIKEHYFEVLDVLENLFISIFEGLTVGKNAANINVVHEQYPNTPFEWLPREKSLRLTFAEGCEMLKEAGIEIDPFDDLSTETEKKLGELVKSKYNTDFYILTRYPIGARPFYTMPAPDDPRYTNSFDIFMRGEEIISGAQRIHVPEYLAQRAQECGLDVGTLSAYIDSFKYGAPPHGGCGVGLERVAMLFLGLNNIRKTSLFPRDPKRLKP